MLRAKAIKLGSYPLVCTDRTSIGDYLRIAGASSTFDAIGECAPVNFVPAMLEIDDFDVGCKLLPELRV